MPRTHDGTHVSPEVTSHNGAEMQKKSEMKVQLCSKYKNSKHFTPLSLSRADIQYEEDEKLIFR